MSAHSSTFDAVVIGGGPAGAAAALTFARAGWNVLLAETLGPRPAPFKIGESLPPSARPLLRDLGLEPRMAVAGHLPSPGTVAVWGSDEPAERDFIRDLHGAGWHLDRPRFDADLRAAAAEAGADLRPACTCLGLQRRAPGTPWTVRLAGREGAFTVSTPWLIDATGRRALIATSQGAPGERDDAQVAFCTVFPPAPASSTSAAARDARSWVESAEDGWWYATRLPDRRRLVAFFTDDDLPAARELSTVSGFSLRLVASRMIGRVLGETGELAPDRVRRFPAGGVSRRAFAGDGWLAVGDASLAFDPLSAQGLFHALYTGLRGAQIVVATGEGCGVGLLDSWHTRLRAIRAAYRHHLAGCHAAETRWPDAPYWRRRHAALAGAAAFATAQPDTLAGVP